MCLLCRLDCITIGITSQLTSPLINAQLCNWKLRKRAQLGVKFKSWSQNCSLCSVEGVETPKKFYLNLAGCCLTQKKHTHTRGEETKTNFWKMCVALARSITGDTLESKRSGHGSYKRFLMGSHSLSTHFRRFVNQKSNRDSIFWMGLWMGSPWPLNRATAQPKFIEFLQLNNYIINCAKNSLHSGEYSILRVGGFFLEF